MTFGPRVNSSVLQDSGVCDRDAQAKGHRRFLLHHLTLLAAVQLGMLSQLALNQLLILTI